MMLDTESSELGINIMKKNYDASLIGVDQSSYCGSTYDNYGKANMSKEERSLLRKLDMFAMPLICMVDFIQYLDKATINYAIAFGLEADLQLQGNQLSILGSIFYLGFLLFQLPNNFLLQRLPLARYIGFIVIAWGTVLGCSALSTNFSQFAAMRFLLGLFEAGIYPCLTLLVSTLYRRSEQITRLGAFWLCNGVAFIVGGLMTYGIGLMEDTRGLASWKWIMIILGSITVIIGILTFFFLIDDPKSKLLCLNAEQEILVEERMRDSAVMRTTNIKKEQIWEALTEIRFWCFCISCLLINLQNGGMTIYSSQITIAFGYTPLQSVLSTIGIGGADIVYILCAIFAVKKTNQTIYVACALMAINNLGLILLLVIPVLRLKLIGLYLTWTYPAAYVLMSASIANNVSGYTKKIFYNGISTVFYTIGNFAGPFLINKDESPLYLTGMLGYIISNVFVIILLLVARWRMSIVNERRLKEPTMAVTNVEDDLSDLQDSNFIYRL